MLRERWGIDIHAQGTKLAMATVVTMTGTRGRVHCGSPKNDFKMEID